MLGKATEFRKGNLKTKLQFGNTYKNLPQFCSHLGVHRTQTPGSTCALFAVWLQFISVYGIVVHEYGCIWHSGCWGPDGSTAGTYIICCKARWCCSTVCKEMSNTTEVERETVCGEHFSWQKSTFYWETNEWNPLKRKAWIKLRDRPDLSVRDDGWQHKSLQPQEWQVVPLLSTTSVPTGARDRPFSLGSTHRRNFLTAYLSKDAFHIPSCITVCKQIQIQIHVICYVSVYSSIYLLNFMHVFNIN